MKAWFDQAILSRPGRAFVLMGVAFFVFGVATLNLFMLLKANADLLHAYGWQALMDGGLRQLVELLVTGYASLAFYLVFKACEIRLAGQLAGRATPPGGAPR